MLHKIAIIRKDADISAKAQKDKAATFGVKAGDFWEVDKGQHRIKDLEPRPNTVIHIYRLDLLAARGAKAKIAARESLLDHLLRFLDSGATIVEMVTDTRVQGGADLIRMFDDATKRFSKRHKTGGKAGRPKLKPYTEQQIRFVREVWDMESLTNDEMRVQYIRNHKDHPIPGFNRNHWHQDIKLRNQND